MLDVTFPFVEAASIDEFYLDLTGTDTLYRLSSAARRHRAGNPHRRPRGNADQHSIGGGTNRLIAKLAVRKAKPANVHIVEPGAEAEFMRDLPLAAIPGIGPRFQERLRSYGLTKVGTSCRSSAKCW